MMVTLLTLALLQITPGEPKTETPALGFAHGLQSCANLPNTDPAWKLAYEAWILGAWSGMNIREPLRNRVGHSTDAMGIIGEVRVACSAEPSRPIGAIVTQLWLKMRAEDR